MACTKFYNIQLMHLHRQSRRFHMPLRMEDDIFMTDMAGGRKINIAKISEDRTVVHGQKWNDMI